MTESRYLTSLPCFPISGSDFESFALQSNKAFADKDPPQPSSLLLAAIHVSERAWGTANQIMTSGLPRINLQGYAAE